MTFTRRPEGSDSQPLGAQPRVTIARHGVGLWTVNEAAAFLRISPGTLYHWASQKRISCIRFGSRCLRFDPQRLELWAQEHRDSEVSHTKTKI